MIKSLAKLMSGFESAPNKTPEFKSFCTTFKREFKQELNALGATNIKFSVGHFYISGFFTSKSGQAYYFSLSDVRGFAYGSHMNKLLYRTAKDYKDFTGGMNQYVPIELGMYERMNVK
ncbi:MAG: hypothetical protein ACOC22_04345 [bacterium]